MYTSGSGDLGSVPAGRGGDGFGLTIGVIARDGLPFLHECLKSIPAQLDGVQFLEIVLVDSASGDGTTEVMAEFARQRPGVRVFRMDGKTNAAATRNVILDNATSGAVLLVDGDIVLTQEFLRAGVDAVRSGRGDAVSGGLTEIQHDTDGKPITEEFWRLRVLKEGADYGHRACGTIFISEGILQSGLRYDEALKLNEDRDFTIRLAREFRVLNVPISMGCHLTRSYFSADRLRQFYRDTTYRWLGVLVRKHLLSLKGRALRTIVGILKAEKGVFLGLFLQLILLAALISGHGWIVWVPLVAALVDLLRFAWQRRLHEYVPLRIVGPWMVMSGLIAGRRARPVYKVRQLA